MKRHLVLTVAVVALYAALLTTSTAWRAAGDPDLFWIAAAGRDLLASGSIPRANVYSFAEASHPWTMHEWLYAAPFAAGLRAFGPSFFNAFGAITGAITIALLAHAIMTRARCPPAGIVVVAFVLLTSGDWLVLARPVFSSTALALAMTVVAFGETTTRVRVAAVVALELVWTNTHGSFPLGVLICAVAAIDRRERLRVLAALFAAAITVINPYGLRLHRLVLFYFLQEGAARTIHERVLEYAPIWRSDYREFIGTASSFGVVTVAVASLVALALTRRRHAPRAILALVLSVEGLLHARHAVLAIVLGSFLLYPFIDERFTERTSRDRAKPEPRVARIITLASAFGVVLAMLQLAIRPIAIAPAMGGKSVGRLLERARDAHVYVPFRSAGLAIWEGSPRGVRVLYDSRNDCYSEPLVRFGLRLKDGDLTDAEIVSGLEEWRVDHVITPSVEHVAATSFDARWKQTASIDRALRASTWTISAQDGGWVLYVRP